MKSAKLVSFVLLFASYSTSVQSSADDYFLKYDLSTNNVRYLDIGAQPLAHPMAFVSSTMKRDLILREDLAKLGRELRVYDFRKGADMIPLFGGGRLDLAFIGGLPGVNLLYKKRGFVIGPVARISNVIVSNKYLKMEDLRGKKISYVPNSGSHLIVNKALVAYGLTGKDVTLVAKSTDTVTAALDSGEVDAYAIWPPFSTAQLAKNPQSKVLYKSIAYTWLLADKTLVELKPEVAVLAVASFVRATNWLRASKTNVERALLWVREDSKALTGNDLDVSTADLLHVVYDDLINIPHLPVSPKIIDRKPPLVQEFLFLQRDETIKSSLPASSVDEFFTYTGVQQVIRSPIVHKIYVYKYEQ